jgi:hypothetical protein
MKQSIKERIRHLLYTLLATFKRRGWSKWVDVGCFEVSGRYYLMQMQYDLETNKKRFRRAKMGWVNDYAHRPELFENAKKYNAD